VCIVWTPIPFLTWLIPVIGHTAICDSNGVTHDIAKPFWRWYVSLDCTLSKTYKYVQLNISKEQLDEYNRTIDQADETYKKKKHSICFNNCHSHIAWVLNRLKYEGKQGYTMFHIGAICTF